MCLLAIRLSLEKCLCKSSACFLTELCFLLLSHTRFYIFGCDQMRRLQILSSVPGLPSHYLLIVSFDAQKLLIFMQSKASGFSLVACSLLILASKSLPVSST